MAIILKANKVNIFVFSVLFVFWYHSPNFLDTPRIFTGRKKKTRMTWSKMGKGCSEGYETQKTVWRRNKPVAGGSVENWQTNILPTKNVLFEI
jgi:hypothetical protein